MILFTHRDDLEHHRRSVSDFVKTLPQKMKEVLSQCDNRYIAFNNRYRSDEERDAQVKDLFAMIDKVVSQNGGRCFTNDVYKDFEKMLVERENKLKEEMEKKKEEELRRIKLAVEEETRKRMEKIKREEDRKREKEKMEIEMMRREMELKRAYAYRYRNVRDTVRQEVEADDGNYGGRDDPRGGRGGGGGHDDDDDDDDDSISLIKKGAKRVVKGVKSVGTGIANVAKGAWGLLFG